MTNVLVDNVVYRLPVGGEFLGRNGDCVEYGLMIARAAVNPWYATTGAELNRLTTESIDAGQAGAAGQMTDANLAWLCGVENIHYVQQPFSQAVLDSNIAALVPCVCGFANGQALPGNESGVFGHAVAILDNAGGYTLANGDSVNGRAGKFDTGVSLSTLQAAHPTTITAIRGQAMLQIQDVSDFYVQIDADTWQCKQNGYLIKLGLLADYRAFPTDGTKAGLTGLGLPMENEHPTAQPNSAEQTFERGIRLYDPDRHVDNPPGSTGPCYSAHMPKSQPTVDTQGIISDANDIIKKASV